MHRFTTCLLRARSAALAGASRSAASSSLTRFALVSRSFSSTSSSASSAPPSETNSKPLTHIDARSNTPMMVDISQKVPSVRIARAQSVIWLPKAVADKINHEQSAAGPTGQHQQQQQPVTQHTQGEIQSPKGPVFATAIIAGTMAVKQTSSLIPFCHQLLIEGCRIVIRPAAPQDNLSSSSSASPATTPSALSSCSSSSSSSSAAAASSSPSPSFPLVVECEVKVSGKTGAEMEALVGCSIAALTVYDMCKAISSEMVVGPTRLLHKSK